MNDVVIYEPIFMGWITFESAGKYIEIYSQNVFIGLIDTSEYRLKYSKHSSAHKKYYTIERR